MKKIKVAVHLVPLCLSSLLMCCVPVLGAQTEGSGATVAVRMIDSVDSSRDPAGKQYRASVTKTVDAGNGVSIPQGAAAMVTLANSGSGYTAQLASVTINGQAVAVSSGSANVTSGAQNAVGSAVHSINSMLGGFGHHVNAPSGATAIAMGQRVVLPPGTGLSFVLRQPPAANPAASAGQPMASYAAPAPGPAASASGSAVSSAGAPFISCATSGGAGIDTYLTGVFQTTRPIKHLPSGGDLVDQSILDDFYAYLKQKGYNFKPGSNYGCDVSPTEAEAKAAQHKRHLEGGCSNCGKTVETGWTEASAAAPEPIAAAASVAPASMSSAGSGGGLFVFCATSAAPGIDIYYTAVFQTTYVRNGPPNGRYFVSQLVPDAFNAYLTQKGYKFKPGTANRCVAKRTEEDAKANQHQWAYGGAGGTGDRCCGNGKIIETGWKE